MLPSESHACKTVLVHFKPQPMSARYQCVLLFLKKRQKALHCMKKQQKTHIQRRLEQLTCQELVFKCPRLSDSERNTAPSLKQQRR